LRALTNGPWHRSKPFSTILFFTAIVKSYFVQDHLCKYILLLCPILTISLIFPLVIAASFTIAVIRTVFIMMAEDWLTAHIVITWSYISALATKDCLSSFRDVSCSKVMTYLSKEVAAVEVSPEDDMSRATAMSSLCRASSKRPNSL